MKEENESKQLEALKKVCKECLQGIYCDKKRLKENGFFKDIKTGPSKFNRFMEAEVVLEKLLDILEKDNKLEFSGKLKEFETTLNEEKNKETLDKAYNDSHKKSIFEKISECFKLIFYPAERDKKAQHPSRNLLSFFNKANWVVHQALHPEEAQKEAQKEQNIEGLNFLRTMR